MAMNPALPGLRLALGPVLYYWPRETLLAFYERVAELPVSLVYLGETVCSKRRSLRTDDWLALARQLAAAGKEVVLSTLALVEAEAELKTLRRLCDNGEFLVEANDMGAVNLLAGHPFIAGPSVNIYNPRTLAYLAGLGLRRWVLPVELGREALTALQLGRPAGVETEVLVYGRLPLAYSARCFTARAHNLPKDDCQYRCLDYPDGQLLETQDAQSFLVLNGIQTQSAHTYNLLPVLGELADLGVEILRISPQSHHSERVVELFHRYLVGEIDLPSAKEGLHRLMPTGPADGYWFGQAGMKAQAWPQTAF